MARERSLNLWRIIHRLREPRAQLAILAALVAVIVLAIVFTDLATGGNAKPPAALGSELEVVPGTRTVVLPTLAPVQTPTPVPVATATPSRQADAVARDDERVRELGLLEAALEKYRNRHHEYPNTNGNTQTLCAYKDLDKGCDLKDVLDKDQEGILEDPLGEPLANGYWYSSDGDSYTIWALREGAGRPGDPVCPEVVPHLKDKGALFCVTHKAEG